MATPQFHPFYGIIIDVFILSGTIFLGQKIIDKLGFQKITILSLSLGMILISQVMYILTLNKITFILVYPITVALILAGGFHLYVNTNYLITSKPKLKLNLRLLMADPIHLFVLIMLSMYILVSFAPPTNADGLNYHWGVPVYLLNNYEWPPLNLWIHGSLAGIGEVFNLLGVSVEAENLGMILQSFSLVTFSLFLANQFSGNKRNFIYLYVITSPVILFFVTSPKPQLFPQILTALALYFTVFENKINERKFLLIIFLLMGAAQQKLSFILTGSVIGIWALWKSPWNSKTIWLYSIVLVVFFFIPRGLWNIQQVLKPNIISFISPLPSNFLDDLHLFRENSWWFPINIFVPESLGGVTTIIGLQIFIIFFIRTKERKVYEIIVITLLAMIATYLFGQPVARSFYEFVLWTAIAFAFIPADEFDFYFFNKLLLLQAIAVFAILIVAVFLLVPGVFSHEWRKKIMSRSAYEFDVAMWANEVIPDNSTVLSELKSVSLLSHRFVPTDWAERDMMKDRYHNAIKEKSPDYIIVKNRTLNNRSYDGCIGEIFSGPEGFIHATRNPFNYDSSEYFVTIYRFNSILLPSCNNLP